MRRILGLSAVFGLCFLLDLIIPQSPLAMPMVGFAPFLCTVMGRSSIKTLIFTAALAGLFHDLFTLQHRLGISSVAYIFSCLLNLGLRRRYYEEKVIPFFGVTFSISLGYSLFFVIFGAMKGLMLTPNIKMLQYQLLLYPMFDAIIGLVGVFIPLKVYAAIKRLFTPKYHES